MKFIIFGVIITLAAIIGAILYTLKKILDLHSQWYAEHCIDK